MPKIFKKLKAMNGVSSKPETTDSKTENNKSPEYYSKLKGLNESVSQWIKTHVDSNPLCILTPIFKDYEKYLKEIEECKESSEKSTEVTLSTAITTEKETTKTTPQSMFTFGSKSTEVKTPTSSINLINKTPTEVKPLEKNTEKSTEAPKSTPTSFVTPFSTAAFTFAPTAKPIEPNAGFSFGSSKPFTFSNVTQPSEEKKAEEENESDEPPKVEFTRVVEEGSVYNVKCKLFAKKGSEFVERGVGQLYIKPVKDTTKTQLIVRADTNLGNLILNVILSKSIPLSRKGKNNIMIVCIPTPEEANKKSKQDEVSSPMQTILIKVKTADDADKLMENLEKYRN